MKPTEKKPMTSRVKNLINQILEGINGDMLIQEMSNNGLPPDIMRILNFSITIFIDGKYVRTRCFNNTKDQEPTPKHVFDSIKNGEVLITHPQHWRSGLAIINHEGAFKADGLIISVAGFPKTEQSEYFAWKILNIVETRLFELNLSLGDLRFRQKSNNYLIDNERTRYGY